METLSDSLVVCGPGERNDGTEGLPSSVDNYRIIGVAHSRLLCLGRRKVHQRQFVVGRIQFIFGDRLVDQIH